MDSVLTNKAYFTKIEKMNATITLKNLKLVHGLIEGHEGNREVLAARGR
jgi:hypothetical protein